MREREGMKKAGRDIYKRDKERKCKERPRDRVEKREVES